jgi:hypothetical protein
MGPEWYTFHYRFWAIIVRLHNPKKGCDLFCRILMLPFLPTREERIRMLKSYGVSSRMKKVAGRSLNP